MEKVKGEISNERKVVAVTNEYEFVNPLIIVVPQWAKASFDKMPKERQEMIASEFIHEITEAFVKLLREK